ncbi:CynX/NimT family MFS transporter [Undibacter mobilis]|uniref:MFS transporter n=1 Tax=Undibacter mobilis TaxID=2292256 RepID=A0A371BBF3_9BRAD|nr:MFS transporter [Undibacter mobilis]RDV04733.1 MFS transporter [Undibacter mobilis]
MPGSSSSTADGSAPARLITALALLWLAGNALRLTILAVPPVIPLIHDDLALSATQVGILTGLPSMLLAIAAVPGSLLIARFGVRAALVAGLMITAVGGALRGTVADVWWLYAMTVAMGAGVAIMQVTMPTAVRAWVPSRIGFATAVYTNGLIVGEILPVALMLVVVLPLVGSWQMGFVFWSVPVAIIAVLVLIMAPRPATFAGAAVVKRKWWPDWRNLLIWRLGIMLGTINAIYFATNAFIPDYLRSTGQDAWISAALSGLNIGQLPASALLLAVAGRLERKIWPYVVCGVLCIGATAGIVFGTGIWLVAAATLQGFAAAAILILVLALPPLLSPPDDVHRVTAAMFTISYTCAVIVPVISGALWDLTHIAAMAFLPIAICGMLLALLAPAISHIPRQHG